MTTPQPVDPSIPRARREPTVPLPAGATDVIYFCVQCKGKATFGVAFFEEVGEPTHCPNCGHEYSEQEQAERIHRMADDTDEDLERKRDALIAKRDGVAPSQARPEDPRAARQAKIEELKAMIAALEAEDQASAGDPIKVPPTARVPGIRLGP